MDATRERAAAFKVGFLKKLAERGLTPDSFAKQAFAGDFLSSVLSGMTGAGSGILGAGANLAGGLASGLATAGLVAPVGIGAGLGVGSALLNQPTVQDIDVLRKMELLANYDRLTKEIKERQAQKPQLAGV